MDVPDELEDAIAGESFDGIRGIWESPGAASDVTRLVLYFDPTADMDAVELCIRRVFERSGRSQPQIVRGTVEDRDWAAEWKKTYTSFPVGESFYVIPSWEEARCPTERMPLRIDPGRAFGTGTHETTQLAVEALERWVDGNHVVLDIGAGSGILSIAARQLGARTVFACDIDEDAVEVARANILLNSESDVWTFVGSVDAIREGEINFVLGNLTSPLIVSLFPEIDRILKPQGLAILSGILHEQVEEVREAIERFHYSIHEELARGQWVALVVEKHVH